MDIDISVLRVLEREKDIPFDVLIAAIEEALLSAYDKTEGAVTGARVELNRKSGHVNVMVPELDDEGTKIGEYDSTPDGFGRVAAQGVRGSRRAVGGIFVLWAAPPGGVAPSAGGESGRGPAGPAGRAARLRPGR